MGGARSASPATCRPGRTRSTASAGCVVGADEDDHVGVGGVALTAKADGGEWSWTVGLRGSFVRHAWPRGKSHHQRSISGVGRLRSRWLWGARARSWFHWLRSTVWVAKAGACRATVVRVSTAWARSVGRRWLPVEPVGVGVGGVEDLVELVELAAVEAVEHLSGFAAPAQVGVTSLELVEVLFDGAALGADGGDGRLCLIDGVPGIGGDAFGVASMPEPGLAGVVVGAPHRRPQLGLELAVRGCGWVGRRAPTPPEPRPTPVGALGVLRRRRCAVAGRSSIRRGESGDRREVGAATADPVRHDSALPVSQRRWLPGWRGGGVG